MIRAKSVPNILLRIEGLIVFLLSVYFYFNGGGDIILFFVAWVLPDLGMIGYVKNSKLGSLTYNLTHTYIIPLILALFFILIDNSFGLQMMYVWFSHLGLDRLAGYGLKYPDKFKNTHMNKV